MKKLTMLMAIIAAMSLGVAGGAAADGTSSEKEAVALSKGDPKDCSDFKNQRRAQKWFHRHHPHRDPAGLDSDHDGKACESNPCPCSGSRWKLTDDLAKARRP